MRGLHGSLHGSEGVTKARAAWKAAGYRRRECWAEPAVTWRVREGTGMGTWRVLDWERERGQSQGRAQIQTQSQGRGPHWCTMCTI